MITLDDVSKRYPNGTYALRDVDVHVEAGDFVFLVGSSGAGKSTVIRLLIREVLPTSGRVIVDGDDVARLPRGRVPSLRRKVGVVFQDFKLLPMRTVYENVAFALIVTGHGGAEVREETERVLSLVGLTQRSHHFPNQLSGGEQQRVAIARALVNHPAILLADEPTGNLDTENSATVLGLLRDLNQRLGQTILMITHNPEAAAYAHRTLLMRDGKIVQGKM